jgi:hypothetical protein
MTTPHVCLEDYASEAILGFPPPPPPFSVNEKKELRLFLLLAAKHWFGASRSESGWTRYVSLDYIYQPNNAYVIKDICIIEAEVNVLGISSPF